MTAKPSYLSMSISEFDILPWFAILLTKVSSGFPRKFYANIYLLGETLSAFFKSKARLKDGSVNFVQKLPAQAGFFIGSDSAKNATVKILKPPASNRETIRQSALFKAMSFILGKKLKMTQIWKNVDVKVVKDKKVVVVPVLKVIPVTVIHAQPNKVAIIRTKERDGYEAVQVSLGKKKIEFRDRPASAVNVADFKLGDMVTVDSFKEGDKVRVSGLNKGRGFQGVVKRHRFAGGPKTHGQKNRHRAPGSIGSTAFQRVVPGRRMAGHMGMERVTIKNLTVAEVDKKNNLIYLKGAVPGMKGVTVELRSK